LAICQFFFSCQQNNKLTLASSKKTSYTIILPENATPVLKNAGTALKNYLKKITDADFEISTQVNEKGNIYLGNAADRKLEEAAITYFVKDKDLYISGGNDQSSLYAVYSFLEQELGCRFYSPEVEKVPIKASLSIKQDLDYQYLPPITTRTVHARLFYKNPIFANKQKVTKEAFPNYVPKARVHTFHRFLPADNFYKKHPEYYALRNGKRIPTQLCLTNEAVFSLVKDSVQAYLNRHPASNVISVSQDDNTQYCQCDNCEALHQKEASPAGSMIYFVNRIAAAFPNKTISTLAYQYTRKAPKNIKPRQNVLITLCSIECDRSAAIAEKCQDFATDLIEWGKLTSNIRISGLYDPIHQFLSSFSQFAYLKTQY
jgi:hypothetical protein